MAVRPAGLWVGTATLVAALLAVALSVMGQLAHGEQATGVIEGIVKMTSPPKPVMVKVTTDQPVCGDAVRDETVLAAASGGVANAVVIVSGVTWPQDPPPAVINNKGCLFVPRVQLARLRKPVSVTSEDKTLHTTHLYDPKERSLFNIALPMPGLKINRQIPPIGGAMRIKCDSHNWMLGWLYVTDNLAAVSGSDGRFRLEAVPAGTYELTVWHEQLKGSPRKVTPSAGRTAEVTFIVQ